MVVAETETGSVAFRDVPIDWEALEDAFENNAPEVHSYLHVTTGEVLRVVDGIADPDMHARIASDASYVRLEPVSSREQYRWMERFIPLVEDEPLRTQLMGAIDGKGAFRRFKDVLMAQTAEREGWFTFRSERLRVFMEAWLEAHHLRAVPRVTWPTEPPPPATPEQVLTISQDQLAGRRTRSAEALRTQLRALAESLGGRDLEKVTAFAEFLKARRAARTYTQRHDGPVAETEGDEEPTSSPEPPRRAAAQ